MRWLGVPPGYSNRHSHCWPITSISSGLASAGSSPLSGSSPVADSAPSIASMEGRSLTPTCAVWVALSPFGPDGSSSRTLTVATTP